MQEIKLQKLERSLKQTKTAFILSIVLLCSLVFIPIFVILVLPFLLTNLIGLYAFTMVIFFIGITAIGITYLVFYIISLVNEFDIEKVHDILLIVGFFVAIVGIVGLYLKSNFLRDEITKLKIQPKDIENKETIIL